MEYVKRSLSHLKFPKLRSGVLWYRDDNSNKRILVNEYFKGPQKIKRIKETEIKLFERFNGALSLEDIASLTGVTLKTVEKVIEHWVTIAPGMFVDEAKDRYKEIAQRMYDESRYSTDNMRGDSSQSC